MEILTLNGIKIAPNTAAAIGFFDGVHIAHDALIKRMIDIADEQGKKKAIITFDVHPKSVLFDLDYTYLTPLERKVEKLSAYEIDYLYVITFDKQKAALTPETFIEYYLNGLQTIVCGFDFKFGVRGSGNANTLKRLAPFDTVVVEELTYKGYKIGSTHIRDLIMSGHVDKVKETLGEYYTIRGPVGHGAKKGRAIGYPTANIDTGQFLIPKKGVYATMTRVDGVWQQSMTSVGHHPTLSCRSDITVESYIFNFDKELYGKHIDIMFIERLRDERKFDDVDKLIDQINEDGVRTREILKNIETNLHK